MLPPMKIFKQIFCNTNIYLLGGAIGIVALQRFLADNNRVQAQREMKLIDASIKDIAQGLRRGEFTSVALVEVSHERMDTSF